MTDPQTKLSDLAFEATSTSFAIVIDRDAFLDLLDSESHVTENAAYRSGNCTLCEKLQRTVARDVEYSGHFDSYVYLAIRVEDDTSANRATILQIIQDHLAWCASLPKRPEVVTRRAV